MCNQFDITLLEINHNKRQITNPSPNRILYTSDLIFTRTCTSFNMMHIYDFLLEFQNALVSRLKLRHSPFYLHLLFFLTTEILKIF
jgi:hypothetical protein